MSENRHPAGTSVGGQWAPGSAGEIDLDDSDVQAPSSLRYAPGGVIVADDAASGQERRFISGPLGFRESCGPCNGSGRSSAPGARPVVCLSCNGAGAMGPAFVSENEIEEHVSSSAQHAPQPPRPPAPPAPAPVSVPRARQVPSARRVPHQHFQAPVGTPIKDVPVGVLRSSTVTQTFRDRQHEATMLILRTQKGELVKVVSRSKAAMSSSVGDELLVSGEVAEHTEYKGEPQTRLASPRLSPA